MNLILKLVLRLVLKLVRVVREVWVIRVVRGNSKTCHLNGLEI